MTILSFRMNYADKKWPEYLAEEFGEETAKKFSVQSHAAAKIHDAKISILNFKEDKELLKKIQHHPNVTSAYLVKKDREIEIPLQNK